MNDDELLRVRFWVQDTQGSGHYKVTGLISLSTAQNYIRYGWYEQAEIVRDEPGWPLYQGEWEGECK